MVVNADTEADAEADARTIPAAAVCLLEDGRVKARVVVARQRNAIVAASVILDSRMADSLSEHCTSCNVLIEYSGGLIK